MLLYKNNLNMDCITLYLSFHLNCIDQIKMKTIISKNVWKCFSLTMFLYIYYI